MAGDEETPAFWKNLPREYSADKRWPTGPIVVPGHMDDAVMLDERTSRRMVNLYHGLRMHFTQYERFDIKQIARMMAVEIDWAGLSPHMVQVRRHMARNGVPGETYLGMLRKGRKPERFTEAGEPSPDTRWMMTLDTSSGCSGAQLFFPTRGMVYRPSPGRAVSWPAHVPYGVAPFQEGEYYYFLEGHAHVDRSRRVEWPEVIDPDTREIRR